MSAKILRRDPEGKWPAEPAERTIGHLELSSMDFQVALQELYRRMGLPPAL